MGCGPSAERKDGDAGASSINDNKAFLFVKPHAVNDKVKELVKKELANRGVVVVSEGEISSERIDKEKLIDKHYYAIASKATLLEPKDLPVPEEKFKDSFGIEWKEVISSGQALNAVQAMDYYGLDANSLEEEWRKQPAVKFGGGFYCAKIDSVPDKEPRFVFNAFFMSMRAAFVAPGSCIYYYECEWPSSKLDWKSFRGELLGPTDCTKAPATSIRGQIFSKWEEFGLANVPGGGENGVHASASPFEGLAERCNWLGNKVGKDPYGRQLVSAGLKEQELEKWAVDPRVKLPSGEEGGVFDALEDTDSKQCQELLLGIQKANA